MGICCMAQETQTGVLYQPRGVGWGGRWEGGSKGRWFMLRFDRKQRNSVKQLSFIKKIIKKKKNFQRKWWNHYCCSMTKLCLTLWDPMDFSMPDSSILHYLLEFTPEFMSIEPVISMAQWTISSSAAPSPFAFNLCQNQGLFHWVGSLDQVAKVLELQHQQWNWASLKSILSFSILLLLDISELNLWW